MTSAIIIHGACDKDEYFDTRYPSLSNSHWFPWLQKELLSKDIFTQTPEMPDAYLPDYKKWKKEFERFDVDENTILIGHSCGGGFLLRWLSENKIRVNKLILVAPWLDPDREQTTDFFEFEIDKDIQNRVDELHIFMSTDDESDIHTSFTKINQVFSQAKIHKFTNKGHFTLDEMKSEKFPELLEVII